MVRDPAVASWQKVVALVIGEKMHVSILHGELIVLGMGKHDWKAATAFDAIGW